MTISQITRGGGGEVSGTIAPSHGCLESEAAPSGPLVSASSLGITLRTLSLLTDA